MEPTPAEPIPQTATQQVLEVKASEDRFTPAHILPVNIDFRDADPYELAQEVVYSNAIVRVPMEKSFKWDGASIPIWLPIVPWLVTLMAAQLTESVYLWVAVAALVLYTFRLLPYMQKMGRHARAMCVHDKLYRAQVIDRVVADAVMLSILESDGVPVDVRTLIYHQVRLFGWIAWHGNKRKHAAKTEAALSVEVSNPSNP